MHKSSVTNSMFCEFKSNYQNYHDNISAKPFVYVDQQGSIKLLTSLVEDDGKEDGIFAVSMADDGWMEILALYEAQ